VQKESVTDEGGCTSEGYLIHMAFVTNMPGQYENGAYWDEFYLFFNTSAQVDCSGGDNSGDNNGPECY
jgi:hypothetical protein